MWFLDMILLSGTMGKMRREMWVEGWEERYCQLVPQRLGEVFQEGSSRGESGGRVEG
jgi:hypothetical protein